MATTLAATGKRRPVPDELYAAGIAVENQISVSGASNLLTWNTC